MEENKIVNNDQPTDSTPEVTGGQGSEKKFTQDDVNRIVAERLAKERAKGQPSEQDQREKELARREFELECRDYLERKNRGSSFNNYPAGLERLLLQEVRSLPEFIDKLRWFERVHEEMNRFESRREAPTPKPAADSHLRSAFGLK